MRKRTINIINHKRTALYKALAMPIMEDVK